MLHAWIYYRRRHTSTIRPTENIILQLLVGYTILHIGLLNLILFRDGPTQKLFNMESYSCSTDFFTKSSSYKCKQRAFMKIHYFDMKQLWFWRKTYYQI
jgi:hypothetical protein